MLAADVMKSWLIAHPTWTASTATTAGRLTATSSTYAIVLCDVADCGGGDRWQAALQEVMQFAAAQSKDPAVLLFGHGNESAWTAARNNARAADCAIAKAVTPKHNGRELPQMLKQANGADSWTWDIS